MKRRAFLVLAAAAAARTADPPLAPRAVVAALDEQVQLRFLDAGFGFGMSRICGPIGHTALSRPGAGLRIFPQPPAFRWLNPSCGSVDWAPFRPLNSQESWVLREAAQAGVEIWTFLVHASERSVEGPVVIGTGTPGNLAEIRQQLLGRAAQSAIPEDPIEGWDVLVKPVRASREACIACHASRTSRAVKPGDPLGYAVYLWRRDVALIR